jgi:uracil phosphoribosyltransferase
MIHFIENPYVISQKTIVRSSSSEPDELQRAISRIGVEIGKKLVEEYFLFMSTIQTPMNEVLSIDMPKIPFCAIVTTRDDFDCLGKGISSILDNSLVGYMDFEGQRGLQALNAKIAHMELPQLKGQYVDTLIIAKAVLATGCTAIHLAKTAISKYLPRRIVIASIFYSKQGVAELVHEIPNADILLIGAQDNLNKDGMLVPGVGDLDKRLLG